MRVLVAARLSVLHDGETGLDTQEREVLKWCESRGHEVVGIALDHKTGKSALWDRPRLRPWVTEPERLAQYDALCCLKVDRLTRAEDEGVDALKAWARKNGKQLLISSAEVRFPSEGMEGGMWDLYIRMAHAEWLEIQSRYKRMQDSRHEAGSLIGRAPWGYEIVQVGAIKTLRPTDDCRYWVPQVMAWIIEGKTLKQVSLLLEEAEVFSGAPDGRWHEATLGWMVKCRTYSGTRLRTGRAALMVESVVSRPFQDEAIAALASRSRMGRNPVKQPKALLAKLKCGHPDCPGQGDWPMYRVNSRGILYYHCTSKGARRKGCGAPMPRLVELDALVLGATEYWDSQPYIERRYNPGNDAGARLEALRTEMAEALRTAPAEKIAQVAGEYATQIAKLEAEGSVAPHWEENETELTEGQYLRSLDLDGQRAYLARKDIKAWKEGPRIHVTVNGALARVGGRSAIAEGLTG